jgi:hypothetical protein
MCICMCFEEYREMYMNMNKYVKVQRFLKLQIVHAFLDKNWNPKMKILSMFLFYFQPL